jgi:hypothetical protein
LTFHADNYAAYLVKSKALERISEKDQRAMDNVAVEPIKSGYVKP